MLQQNIQSHRSSNYSKELSIAKGQLETIHKEIRNLVTIFNPRIQITPTIQFKDTKLRLTHQEVSKKLSRPS